MEGPPMANEGNQRDRLLKLLEVLKEASRDLQTKPHDPNSPAVEALLSLRPETHPILSADPNFSALSLRLSHLQTLVHSLRSMSSRAGGLRSFLTRRLSAHEISRLAAPVASEAQAWIDRARVEELVAALRDGGGGDGRAVALLESFEARVSQGFDRDLQDLVLRSRVLASLERVLCESGNGCRFSKEVRERAALAIAALIRFNKDVFVGEVLMGPTVRALVSMASVSSIRVLCSLIRLIKSPLVDEIESNGEIPKIIGSLSSPEQQIRIAAVDCVLEIGYYGRKEAIEAMLQEGLIKKLMELQRSEMGGDLIDLGMGEKNRGGACAGEVGVGEGGARRERMVLEMHPFASCVARFAVQLEVGEGLRQRERRAFKLDILRRVREASVSDAEAATIVAEVLWGSSP